MCLAHLASRHQTDPVSLDALSDGRLATERVNRIVENMLDLVRMESRRLVLHRSAARPADLLATVAEARGPLVRNRTVHVDRAGRPGPAGQRRRRPSHPGHRERRGQLAPPRARSAGHIVLKAEARGDVATITIGNDGPPVPSDMRETIFEKYARGESGRPHQPGAGPLLLPPGGGSPRRPHLGAGRAAAGGVRPGAPPRLQLSRPEPRTH